MKYLVFLVSLCSFSSHALPEILDYYPECSSGPAATMKYRAKTMVDRQMLRLIDEPGFQQVLQSLRETAQKRGADAISIEKLTMELQLKDSTLRDKRVPLILEFNTTLFRFCQDDQRLSQQRTPYNSQGERIVSGDKTLMSTQIKLDLPKKSQPAPNEVEPGPVSTLVSLEQGIAGVKPGMSSGDVSSLLGKPSALFYLSQGGQLWSYGRTLWLKFGQQLEWVANQQTLLSQEAVNRIRFSDSFDHSHWSLADNLRLKTDLSTALPLLNHSYQQISAERWQQQKDGLILTLGFEPYVNKTDEASTLRWRDFSLASKSTTAPQLEMTNAARQRQWLTQLQQSADPGAISLSGLSKTPLHQLDSDSYGEWLVAGEQLLLQYRDSRLNRLIISPPLVRQSSDKTAQLLEALQLPSQKKDYLQRFPQAFDQGDKLNINLDDRSMELLFDSEEPTAAVLQLELILH